MANRGTERILGIVILFLAFCGGAGLGVSIITANIFLIPFAALALIAAVIMGYYVRSARRKNLESLAREALGPHSLLPTEHEQQEMAQRASATIGRSGNGDNFAKAYQHLCREWAQAER